MQHQNKGGSVENSSVEVLHTHLLDVSTVDFKDQIKQT